MGQTEGARGERGAAQVCVLSGNKTRKGRDRIERHSAGVERWKRVVGRHRAAPVGNIYSNQTLHK